MEQYLVNWLFSSYYLYFKSVVKCMFLIEVGPYNS